MSGCTTAFALRKLGIHNVRIFDENPEGTEGPWITYARMKTLRSDKELMGPALGIPHLTFRAWYVAQYGEAEWNHLRKIPNHLWMDYLSWYRKVLDLPVENEYRLIEIVPQEGYFELVFEHHETIERRYAQKVVLATGRTGFGGCEVPAFMESIPKDLYAHSCENIDYTRFKGKRIAVIGAGASGWDAAGTVLEEGALQVDMLMRRKHLPNDNGFGDNYYPGYQIGFAFLADEQRAQFMQRSVSNGVPPPKDSIDRACCHPNFNFITNTPILKAELEDGKVILTTQHGEQTYDYVILATGFCIDGLKQIELAKHLPYIEMWEDRLPPEVLKMEKLRRFPYLGKHFEFREKVPGSAPYLKDLYCFNYAAFLSHGGLSIDILGINLGAMRLAEGIAIDFYTRDADRYYDTLNEILGKPE